MYVEQAATPTFQIKSKLSPEPAATISLAVRQVQFLFGLLMYLIQRRTKYVVACSVETGDSHIHSRQNNRHTVSTGIEELWLCSDWG